MRLFHFLLFATLSVGKFAQAGEFTLKEADFFTLSCISGLEYAEMRAYCAKKFPELKDPLERSIQGWRSRNAEALKEISNACEERMQKLESEDASRLKEVKKYAEQISAVPIPSRKGYDEVNFKSDCRALAEEFANPQRAIISENFAREIRTVGIK